MRFLSALLTSLLFSVDALLAQTQPIDPRRELEEYQDIEPLNQGVLGDRINHDTGGLTFRHVDVDLPGNSALPVRFSRRMENNPFALERDGPLGDWTIGVPFIQARALRDYGWRSDRCTNSSALRHSTTEVRTRRYWNGIHLHHPDQGKKQLFGLRGAAETGYLRNSGAGQVKLASKDYWIAHCINSIPAGGEGFLVTAPNGDKYRFDHLVYYKDGGVEQYYTENGETEVEYANADSAIIYVSEVTDVNGNWVRYAYGPHGPTSITSNDGRRIDIAYTSGRVSSVTANGRSWGYAYHTVSSTKKELERVTLPDNRQWLFHDMGWVYNELDPTDCAGDPFHSGQVHLTSPDGVVGRFDVEIIRNARTAVFIEEDMPRSAGEENCYDKRTFTSLGTTQKQLTVPGAGVYTWQYAYPYDSGSWYDEDTLTDLKQREIYPPDGSKKVLHFNRRSEHASEGLLMREELFESPSSPSPIEVIDHEYLASHRIGETVSDNAGVDPVTVSGATDAKLYIVRKVQTTVSRSSEQHVTDYNYNYNSGSPSYNYLKPTSIVQRSSLHPSQRVQTNAFTHLTVKWVLDIPDTVTRNGKLFDDYDYDSLGRVIRHERFGSLFKTFGYHGSGAQGGALAWAEDALSRRTSYDNYKRGTPQLITRADNSTILRVADDNGWVTSQTNPRGVTTGYEYNAVGWLTKIDPASPWSDTTISYSNLGSGLVQTSTRGQARTTTTHDGFLRPVLVKTEALSGGGLTTYVKTDYDAFGRAVFTSQASTLSNPTAGVETQYDALSRITQTRETVSPNATTTYAYLPGTALGSLIRAGI